MKEGERENESEREKREREEGDRGEKHISFIIKFVRSIQSYNKVKKIIPDRYLSFPEDQKTGNAGT